jgi:hypothetical protein
MLERRFVRPRRVREPAQFTDELQRRCAEFSSDGGKLFRSIFRGLIDGSTIRGEWLDVRSAHGFGGDTNMGTLTLELDGTLISLSGFQQVSSTGGWRQKPVIENTAICRAMMISPS